MDTINFENEEFIRSFSRGIDFIRANIEGSERDMLRGAKNVLQHYAPKLAISTNHLPDDPKVLEDIILEFNPKYKIIQFRKNILFAQVVE